MVERQIRNGKALRRAGMHRSDRFIGMFDGSELVACGYHRDEPGLNARIGQAGRYVLFIAVADRAQGARIEGQRASDLMLRAVHSDIAHRAAETEVVAARANHQHVGSLRLLQRNNYLVVPETPQPTDLLHVASL